MNEKNQSKKGVLSVSSKYTISNQLVNSECGGQSSLRGTRQNRLSLTICQSYLKY